MDRRNFLKLASTVGIAGTAGCQTERDDTKGQSPTPTQTQLRSSTTTRTSSPIQTESRSPDESQTDTPPSCQAGPTVDEGKMTKVTALVSAGDDVSRLVDDIRGGELLIFPSGRFRWEAETHVTADDWGIRCRPDTVFEVPSGAGDGEEFEALATHVDDSTADNFVLENLTFDSPGRAAPGLHIGARVRACVRNLEYKMNGPLTDRWHENGVRAYVQHRAGKMLIDNYRQFNNGDLGGYADGDSRVGVWVGSENNGTIHLRNPVLQGFPNNACYVSRQPGTVTVEGGLLTNNNVSAVRVSGGVEVHGTTIHIDIDRYRDGPGRIGASDHNTRGVWGDNRNAGTDGGLVRDVSYVLRNYRRCTGLATILENPRMTLRNNQFLLDADIEGVQADHGIIEVVGCRFDGRSIRSTAGIGAITGSGNHVARNISPGAVRVASRSATFDWSRTHPETPR